jgi:hypothetical protein
MKHKLYYVPVPYQFLQSGFTLQWDGICHVDTEPAGDGLGDTTPQPSGDSGNADLASLQAQLQELQKQNQAYSGIIEKLRPVERNYKKLEAILGDTDPEKLQQLREADQRLKQQQDEINAKILEAQNKTAAEYKQQIEAIQKENQQLSETKRKTDLTFELFKAFNVSDGIGDSFEGFLDLSMRYFDRNQEGTLQVKDDLGKQVIFKGEDGERRPATPAEFMKMLAADDLEDYQFSNKRLMQYSFNAYNQSKGAGLPANNGHDIPKNLSELPQSELFRYAFKEQ